MLKNLKKKNTGYIQTSTFKHRKKLVSGYTLIEVLFYVVLFALLSIVLLDSLISMTGLFMKTITNRDIVQGATIMENISRELKQADNFSFNSDILTVNTLDEDGDPKTITYTFSSPNIGIVVLEDSVTSDLGNLNSPNISVTDFNVILINTLKSKAAKINLTIGSNRDSESQTEDFQNTVVLRGSY